MTDTTAVPRAAPGGIVSCAPGKVVLWGEYAVLAGAPAAVLAVDRFATVRVHVSDTWRFTSTGLLTAGIDLPTAEFCRAPAAHMTGNVLASWGYTAYPQTFSVHTDSTGFYRTGTGSYGTGTATPHKLGIGSSAAVCTATCHALARLFSREIDVTDAIAAHQQFQNGKGSGLDVAASWHGGLIIYRQDGPHIRPISWLGELHWRVIWTGSSSHTASHLSHFSRWRSSADQTPLHNLRAASEQLAEAFTLDHLAAYQQCLQQLDSAADLNIFTPQHRELATIAHRMGLVYKPCGAGGGDIGIAVADNAQVLAGFCDAALQQNLPALDMEIAQHGVQNSN